MPVAVHGSAVAVAPVTKVDRFSRSRSWKVPARGGQPTFAGAAPRDSPGSVCAGRGPAAWTIQTDHLSWQFVDSGNFGLANPNKPSASFQCVFGHGFGNLNLRGWSVKRLLDTSVRRERCGVPAIGLCAAAPRPQGRRATRSSASSSANGDRIPPDWRTKFRPPPAPPRAGEPHQDDRRGC